MNIRNFGIFAHIDSGKTTLVERILYESGKIPHPGSIQEGTTESDFNSSEIQRGISIYNSVFQFGYEYGNSIFQLNIIDTPGHLDFGLQVESALLAVDTAVLLIDAVAGIQTQTELLLNELVQHKIPVIIFINKIDKFIPDLAALNDRISELSANRSFLFFKDQKMELFESFDKFTETQKIKLIEKDEQATQQYLENPESIDDLAKKSLLKKFRESALFPVIAGSAKNGQGVRELLDWLCFLQPGIIGHFGAAGVLFKKTVTREREKISYVKTFQDIKTGDLFFQGRNPFVIEKIFSCFGQDLTAESMVTQFSIFATVLPGNWSCGELLLTVAGNGEVRQNTQNHFGILIESDFIEDRTEILTSLELVCWEDESLEFRVLEETGQIELRGRGELHLEVALGRLKEICNKNFKTGKLNVVRYDSLKILVKNVIFRHSVYGGERESGDLSVSLEKSLDFKNEVVFETELSDQIKNSIETAFYEVMSHGISGREVVGIKLRIHSYKKPVSSSEELFRLIKVAVISGLKKALVGNTECIGPVSFLEILLPTEDIGLITSELQRCNVRISGIDSSSGDRSVIRGEAAAENLLGFAAVLRNMTHGRGFLYSKTAFQKENFAIL